MSHSLFPLLLSLALLALLAPIAHAGPDWVRPPIREKTLCDGCYMDDTFSLTPRVYANPQVIDQDFGGGNFLQLAFDARDENLAFWGWYAFNPMTVEACQSVIPEYVYMLKYQRKYYYGREHIDAVYIHTAFVPTATAWGAYCVGTYGGMAPPGARFWIARDGQPTTSAFRTQYYKRLSIRYKQEDCLLNKKLSSISELCEFETVGTDSMFPSERFCGVYTGTNNFTASVVLSMGCDGSQAECNSHYQTLPQDIGARSVNDVTENDQEEAIFDPLSAAAASRQVNTITDLNSALGDEDSDIVCWYSDVWGFPAQLSLLSSAMPLSSAPLLTVLAAVMSSMLAAHLL